MGLPGRAPIPWGRPGQPGRLPAGIPGAWDLGPGLPGRILRIRDREPGQLRRIPAARDLGPGLPDRLSETLFLAAKLPGRRTVGTLLCSSDKAGRSHHMRYLRRSSDTCIQSKSLSSRAVTPASRARPSGSEPVTSALAGSLVVCRAMTSSSRSQIQEQVARVYKALGQSWNSSGVSMFLHIIRKEPELAMPHVSVPNLRWVNWKALQAAGVQAVVMDKDNTVTAPYVGSVPSELKRAVEDCKATFPGRVAVMSNSAGLLQYDPDGSIADALERSLGLPVVRHSEKKPAGSAASLERQLRCPAKKIAFIGDRNFTDIVYGNRNGLLTIYTSPLVPEKDPFVVKKIRPYEQQLIDHWTTAGIKAPKHPLLTDSPYAFIKDPACW